MDISEERYNLWKQRLMACLKEKTKHNSGEFPAKEETNQARNRSANKEYSKQANKQFSIGMEADLGTMGYPISRRVGKTNI